MVLIRPYVSVLRNQRSISRIPAIIFPAILSINCSICSQIIPKIPSDSFKIFSNNFLEFFLWFSIIIFLMVPEVILSIICSEMLKKVSRNSSKRLRWQFIQVFLQKRKSYSRNFSKNFLGKSFKDSPGTPKKSFKLIKFVSWIPKISLRFLLKIFVEYLQGALRSSFKVFCRSYWINSW